MGRNQASLIVTQYFLGSISEAKNHLEDSRTRDDEDLKSVYQPITELCALSEVCTYPDDSKGIPLVNIFASRHTYYRPFQRV